MPVNSRQKGKEWERAACEYLAKLGFPGATRTAQCRGKTNGEPDIVCPGLPSIHFEVKCNREIEVGSKVWEAACRQAATEAKPGTRWVVLWKPFARPWCLTFDSGGVWGCATVTGDDGIRAVLER